MRIRYDVTIDNGRARVSFSTNPDSGNQGEVEGLGRKGGAGEEEVGTRGGGRANETCCDGLVIIGPTIVDSRCGCGGVEASTPPPGHPIPANPKVLRTVLGDESAPLPPILPKTTSEPEELSGFVMNFQEHTFWCWAAVGQAVDRFIPTESSALQCEIATLVSNIQSCSVLKPYDQPEALDLTLQKLRKLRVAHFERVAPFGLIQSEINAGRPVCARIAWDTNRNLREDGAHFVAIAGWDIRNGENYVLIADPFAGGSRNGFEDISHTTNWLRYDDFSDVYRLTGKWVSTYFVKEGI